MASILNVIDAVTNFWDKFSKGAKWFSMNCYYILFIIVSSIIIPWLKSNNSDCLTGSIVSLFILSIFVVFIISFAIAALWKKKKWKIEN
jgi:Mn2+/Fe2+ NRAMP family transporter